MDTSLVDVACALPHDPTAERVLKAELDEIRWSHSSLRVCCGVFCEPSLLRIVASSEPAAMQPLTGTSVHEDGVQPFRALLDSVEQLSSSDVTADARLIDVPQAILGEDTQATVVLPLRARQQTIGFLRLDAREVGPIDGRAVAAAQAAIAAGVLAVSLEAELVRSHELSRQLLQARRWIHERLEREHEGLRLLRKTVDALGQAVQDTSVSEAATRTLSYALEDLEQRLEAVAAQLDRHAIAARHAGFFPEDAREALMRNRRRDRVERREGNAPSTRGRLE